ncbi:hypothetical protein ACFPYI_09745 [Halomarina salina]|uniref:Uncharacterized protein n=1 Tax=Halomarina salina TaxID=1872699 RepID=A0ABD5RM15_9EURY|nr:hypothetical protein [Halomarina salina]
MSAHAGHGLDARQPTATGGERRFPAYGPVDAVLGYVLFYVVVTRATPTATAVLADVLDVSRSLVGLGLALFLWFVLLMTAIEQVRRQLGALGVGVYSNPGRWKWALPAEPRALVFLVVALLGGVVAAWTFESAVETAVALIPVVARPDVAAFDVDAALVMAVFFVAFGLASAALDRLVVDGARTMLAE